MYYQVAGYDVYSGEVIITIGAIVLAGVLAIFGRTVVRVIHAVFAILQVLLVVVIFIGIVAYGHATAPGTFGFVQTSVSDGLEIFNITMLAPWMFVGFEAVTYMIGSGERRAKNIDKVMAAAVVCGMLAYALPLMIPVLALPEGYTTWTAYLADANGATGLFGLPVFYSVFETLGIGGLNVLVAAIVCAIFTSLFGLFRVTSRLVSQMAEEELLPEIFTHKNKNGEPFAAMILVMAISVVVPFFGRTAIGWIVDVTTISATIVYVYSAGCSLYLSSRDAGSGLFIKVISLVGAVFSVVSFLFLLIPNIFSKSKLATESYFILFAWSVIGLVYYWIVFRRDKKDIFGKSTVMWMLMLFLLFFSAIMWVRQRLEDKLGFTDLALDSDDPAQVKDYLGKIKSSGNHLLALINDVLEMSRIESGKISMHAVPMNIESVFADLESILHGQAEAHKHKFTVDTSKVTDVNVICDKLRLNQVLYNLASNAIKYTPDGGNILISAIQTGMIGEKAASYRISVKDNGIGMTLEFAEKVFEAFERNKDAELKGIQGTGLGMSITKRIVDLMGGTIRVESAPNEGSDFIVELSLDICEEADVLSAEDSDTDADSFVLEGKRVLLVDDIEINREIAVATLEMFELKVEEAFDGQDAYEKVAGHDAGYYDAVLMDIQMPVMNGYESARAIRALSDADKASVPIIAMTANAFEEDIKNAEEAGMNGHVAKPIDREKLAEQLAKVILR